MSILEIKNLGLSRRQGEEWVPLVEKVSLALEKGQTLALVGESGSGKTLTGLALARLLPEGLIDRTSGEVWVDGLSVWELVPRELMKLRGGTVAYVFQDPHGSLNPAMNVGRQVLEVLQCHRPAVATEGEVIRWFGRVGLDQAEEVYRAYPHQLSGGMKQRVLVAMALCGHPKILIADEPTSALDVSLQHQIIDLLKEFQRELELAVLFITHDLRWVKRFADAVAVMYSGRIVEYGAAQDVVNRPCHPYTQALWDASLSVDSDRTKFRAIPGRTPSPGEWPTCCRFHPRCRFARPLCSREWPQYQEVGTSHWALCPHWKKVRNEMEPDNDE